MQPLYVTTPLYYVNDAPHVGHAYTTVVADALARVGRARGRDVRFLTGTDEHGQKIEETARAKGLTPRALADDVVARFKATWTTLGIAYDDFLRTTEPRHEKGVLWLWSRLAARGDIYLGDYEGFYCVACEAFYPENQLEMGPGGTLCPTHEQPITRVKEQSYFFRMSRYQEQLIGHLEANLRFVTPAARRNEVLSFLRGEKLQDLSISRTSFRWGIPVPGDPAHVIYVWLDALTNYVSALGAPEGELFARYWRDGEVVQLLGKDILRFHAVIWPCMLMAAELPLPATIATHGWWTVRGQKIAKSMPATRVDPNVLARDLGADALRYFLLREVPLGLDGDFNYEALLGRYRADLGNDLGNLVNRSLAMAARFVNGRVPEAAPDASFAREADAATAEAAREWDALQPSKALEATFALVRAANGFIDRAEPWVLAKAGKSDALAAACRTFLEACLVIGRLVAPVMPERAAALCRQLGFAASEAAAAAMRWPLAFGENLPVGQLLGQGEPLFPRLDPAREAELLARWIPADATPLSTEVAPRSRAALERPAPVASSARPLIGYDEFARLDLRTARVLTAERIAKSDKLLRLELDVGAERRQVVAGVASAYAPEMLVGRTVIFLANLKPATIRGVESQGMILAAGEDEVVALSALDRDVPPGTRVR